MLHVSFISRQKVAGFIISQKALDLKLSEPGHCF